MGPKVRDKRATQMIATAKQSNITPETQQRLLDVFTLAFPTAGLGYDLKAVLQEVKGHLFNRDFETAFGKEEYLDVYAARWSAARALAYADIFSHDKRQIWFKPAASISTQASRESQNEQQSLEAEKASAQSVIDVVAVATLPETDTVNIACIGGGAGAEIAALAAVSSRATSNVRLNIYTVDVANWDKQVKKLYTALSTPPPLSPFASQAVRDSNAAFVNRNALSVTFLQRDILALGSHQGTTIVSDDASQQTSDQSHKDMGHEISRLLSNIDLVTMMFTLNELFSASMAKTTALLLHLTDVMKAGSRLVVVDSPGSYSELKLGKTSDVKKYPMKWLLDHTLLNVAGQDRWSKVENEDSQWFRLEGRGKHLRYSLELENCRYQIHVYEKQ